MSTITISDISGGSISDILNNIQNLQSTEQKLITQLDQYTSASGYTSGDTVIIDLVDKINSIADSRIVMFQTLSNSAHLLQAGVSQSRTDLVAQMTLLQVVEDQLNQAKKQIDRLQNRNDTKMRMVEINTYYGKRYEAQGNLMKKIIMVCMPILVLFILKKKGILPETIANYVIGITIAVGAFFIVQSIWDISTRSNMEFDQYNWAYAQPDSQVPTKWQYNKANLFKFDNLFANLMENLGVCVSDKCCDKGLAYDKKLSRCVIPPGVKNSTNSITYNNPKTGTATTLQTTTATTTTKQAFTTRGGNLQGTVINSYVSDNQHSLNGIEPFSYDSAFASV